MVNVLSNTAARQATGARLTVSELNRLAQALDREERLVRLGVEGANACRSAPVRAWMAELARARMDCHNGMLQTLAVAALSEPDAP